MPQLAGRIAWVTGAGSGIGEASALALAEEGAVVVLTGRRTEMLAGVAAHIRDQGGSALVQPADLTDASQVQRVGAVIKEQLGRLDILVNNAGVNIRDRGWDELTPAGIDEVVRGNLTGALYCVTVALPMMRAQQDGLLIHTASVAGRVISPLSGPVYTATKHAIVAMSHSINMEECVSGIRSSVVLPGEVATPLLDNRPTPVSPEERAGMLQPKDCADLVRFIACLPRHVCLNEAMITPAWNRAYVGAAKAAKP